ncbi:morphogenetic protein [Citrobacter amalonaticus]|uniref:Morphogenetic protein n=1 Tax=Citrobacter amalonaticus TaxID=35703 RepID=A0ABY0I0I7_CITAM|nr:morphogenetic protein [Citrobacter amalonaticus]MZK87987.1 morphogenetic protein [Citrobacter amalonaticus]MZK92516.1 morphogenetic protein [Citrobacter amalonaticus]MZL02286.1 morphogenetic protein [Citrobacter amalonaticus]MZL15006.1 morphogenetic protein [Citrobacter amalonaticus]MZL24598.1 morphogenetic protein [Citrobacter amalonaticus]
MKERGMIFNGEMVRAILDGGKTQTRRPLKVPHIDRDAMCELSGNELAGELSAGNYRNSPHGKPGDRIWVRETWARYNIDQDSHDMAYQATPPADWPEEGRWRPSIHMPRWASRLTLEITSVRVERLNSISQEDAQAEGMELTGWRPTYSDPDSGGEVWTPYDNFAQLWKSIYGEESWKANPWVWVIEFKVVPNVQDNPA